MMKPKPVFLAEITNRELELFLKEHHTIYITVGATEQHGPHSPVSTEVLIPEEIARKVGPEAMRPKLLPNKVSNTRNGAFNPLLI